MAESVFVEFPEKRTVYIDGSPAGRTGDVFNVESGTHWIDLGEPPDYVPPGIAQSIAETSPLDPLVIKFELSGEKERAPWDDSPVIREVRAETTPPPKASRARGAQRKSAFRSTQQEEASPEALDSPAGGTVDLPPVEPWLTFVINRASSMAARNDLTLDAVQLLAAALMEAAPSSDTDSAWFVRKHLSNQRGLPTERLRDLLDLDNDTWPDLGDPRTPAGLSIDSQAFLQSTLEDAKLAAESASSTAMIDTRHLMAVLLRDDADSAAPYLRSLSVDDEVLRRDLFDFIVHTHPDDQRPAWRRLLAVQLNFGLRNRTAHDMWTREDMLGYRLYAKAIAGPIRKKLTEPPLTIGIQAPWGQGKTSLMRMIQQELDEGVAKREAPSGGIEELKAGITSTYDALLRWTRRARGKETAPSPDTPMLDTSNGRIPTVWFNPLYYRETAQIWSGMAHAILHQLADRLGDRREEFWLRLQLSRLNVAALRRDIHQFIFMRAVPIGVLAVAVVAILLAQSTVPGLSALVSLVSGAASTALAYAWKKVRTIDRQFDKYVIEPNYLSELGLLHLVDHDLERALHLLAGDEAIAVFIDDLDRCDPQTVNQVILAINQFLSLPRRNVFFFLGMDMDMVAGALEKAQGEAGREGSGSTLAYRTFGWRFMEKFVQLPFVIPHLDATTAKAFASNHLRGKAAPAPQAVAEIAKDAAAMSSVVAIGELARTALAQPMETEERIRLQETFSEKATELMDDPKDEEIASIVEAAIDDLELNPRTIKRYFSLVRVLRNIQVASGGAGNPDVDRLLVIRAAHLLLNWPQFMQWLVSNSDLLNLEDQWTPAVAELEAAVTRAATHKDWCRELRPLLRRIPPPFLKDVTLYRYLRKITGTEASLSAMYAARFF